MRSRRTAPEKRDRKCATARKELKFFFRAMTGSVPNGGVAPPAVRAAAIAIDGWLSTISTYHRGALWHRYTRRPWPRELVARYRQDTGVVVRLECAVHPWDGHSTTEELEQAAVQRLLGALIKRVPGAIASRLPQRASSCVREALDAYVAARGELPCVVPGEHAVTPSPSADEEAAQ